MFETQVAERALSRAWAKTGNRIAARIAMIAMTTSSSMSVNALDIARRLTNAARERHAGRSVQRRCCG
jgi:hypothetical protein